MKTETTSTPLPEPNEVFEQLERITSNRHFSLSKRLPLFLRYVVERTLAGAADQLKERTLGIDVFGKDSHYDPAESSVVRVTAAEIRKRLALYYQDPDHEHELRIILPIGSYVPVFHWPVVAEGPVEDIAPEIPLDFASPLSDLPITARSQKTYGVAFALLCLAVFVATAAYLFFSFHSASSQRAINGIWRPMFNAKEPILIVVAGHQSQNLEVLDAADPSRKIEVPDRVDTVSFDDLHPLTTVSAFLRANGAHYDIRDAHSVTMTDLKKGPAIVVGAYCNTWTLRLVKPLRFHFANDATMQHYWIVDGQSRTPSSWIVDRTQLGTTRTFRDYAILGRFVDSDLGQPVVVVAGIGGGSTMLAGDLVTDPEFLTRLIAATPGGSSKKNIEAVFSTQLVDGHAGTPRLEASYAW